MTIKLIMPMAGSGERFKNYSTLPKPLIPVDGIPMFQFAEQNIGIDFDERIFIVRKDDNISEYIKGIYPEAKLIELDNKTEGTACTLLTAREHFDDGSSIFIANCDQYVDWHSKDFTKLIDTGVDGIIATFHEPERSPKWSYAQVDKQGYVTKVAEKDPISDLATVGYYYFKDGRDFITAAEDMIGANDRVNNEFYTCPVYNYYLKLDKKVITFNVNKMVGVGTPEDLDNYNSNKLFQVNENCAVCVSGGADSAMLLYKVLQNNKGHTHVFTYANNTLLLKNVVASTSVVNKCVELTGNHRLTHHVIHNTGDKPNGVDPLFDMVEPYSVSLGIKTLFIGVTKNPPKEVTDKFTYPEWKDTSRDIDKLKDTMHKGEVFETVLTPWINTDKKGLAQLYQREGVLDTLFPVTYSCEWYPRDGSDPGMEHCGKCWWCEERQWGFGRLK
tara:strand:- start:6437 stop:7768 length:1332 start_codon:yes stop_codon:yes gene_type:complete